MSDSIERGEGRGRRPSVGGGGRHVKRARVALSLAIKTHTVITLAPMKSLKFYL